METKSNLKIAATNVMRGEIAAQIAFSFYGNLRGTSNKVTLILGSADSEMGGTSIPLTVSKKKYDLGFANPAALARMAFLGRGFYKAKLPLRAIGVFPSWDRLVFAINPQTGISSLAELKEKKYPLRVSTRKGGKFHSTLFAIDEVLKGYGFSFRDIESWGGKIMRVSTPRSKERRAQIESGEVDAVFDEGLKSWGDLALQSGMSFLPIANKVLERMERIGYTRAEITPNYFPQLKRSIVTLDFSGWLLFCHSELQNDIAYEIASKVDSNIEKIPVDHFDKRPMVIQEFCKGGEAGPLCIPLHPGAKKYFKGKGYLG